MGEEKIGQYEEELFTEETSNGFWIKGKKVFTNNRDLDEVNDGKREEIN